MIMIIFVSIVIIIVSAYFCYKNYKKCKDDLEKTLYIMLFIAIFTPLTIYYIDRYNIPSLLNWNKNVNTQNWLSFFATYSASIIGAFIGAIFLVLVTIMQINKNNEDNLKRDKEERKINNMPLLQYFLDDVCTSNKLPKILETKIDNGIIGEINLRIKNIGMNAVKKCVIKIEGNALKKFIVMN